MNAASYEPLTTAHAQQRMQQRGVDSSVVVDKNTIITVAHKTRRLFKSCRKGHRVNPCTPTRDLSVSRAGNECWEGTSGAATPVQAKSNRKLEGSA